MEIPESHIRIVDFDPCWRDDFARLNVDWLERWFVVEAVDREVLGDPETHILANGGRVLFALLRAADGSERAVGTVALKHEGEGVYELTKMAVEEGHRGAGVSCSWNPAASWALRWRCTKALASDITPRHGRVRTTPARMSTWSGNRSDSGRSGRCWLIRPCYSTTNVVDAWVVRAPLVAVAVTW